MGDGLSDELLSSNYASITNESDHVQGLDGVEQAEGLIGWYDATLWADERFKDAAISPRDAALLLCGFNPREEDISVQIHISNEEICPNDIRKLVDRFEDTEMVESGRRTLRNWHDIARNNSLKYHSWIDRYLEAVKTVIEGDPTETDCVTKQETRNAETTSSHVKDIPKLVSESGEKIGGRNIIPGKVPRTAIGRTAVRAAWEIECREARRAGRKEVIALLQVWAKDGSEPDVLKESIPRGVIWITEKGIEKNYDLDACGKTLEAWWKSRN